MTVIQRKRFRKRYYTDNPFLLCLFVIGTCSLFTEQLKLRLIEGAYVFEEELTKNIHILRINENEEFESFEQNECDLDIPSESEDDHRSISEVLSDDDVITKQVLIFCIFCLLRISLTDWLMMEMVEQKEQIEDLESTVTAQKREIQKLTDQLEDEKEALIQRNGQLELRCKSLLEQVCCSLIGSFGVNLHFLIHRGTE